MNKLAITSKNEVQFSKYLSYLLRHNPEDVGLELMDDGWIRTYDLIEAINNSNSNKYFVTLSDLKHIVSKDNKQRYSFKSDDNDKFAFIRANQGHSIKDLNIKFDLVTNPPRYLYHGTSKESAQAIMNSGEIKPMSRQMVHLSKDLETAISVGKRHSDKVVVFQVDVERAMTEGKRFYISDNGVYLVDKLDTKLLTIIDVNT